MKILNFIKSHFITFLCAAMVILGVFGYFYPDAAVIRTFNNPKEACIVIASMGAGLWVIGYFIYKQW